MKFASSKYTPQKRINDRNTDTPNDNYSPKVRIPNYTTPVYSTSKSYNETTSTSGPMNNHRLPSQPNESTPPSIDRMPTRPTTPNNMMPTPPPSPNNRMPMPPSTPNNRMPMPPSTPNNRMPMPPSAPNNRVPTSPNVPNNRIPPRPGMPNNGMPTTPNRPMPNNSGYYDNWNNNYMPDMSNGIYNPNNSMYNRPVGVPIMPLYGYDNYEDAEKDWGYFRQLYPGIARRILREIDEECDKLEYDGSCMFDEYPDRAHLGRMVDKIYNKIKDEIEEPIVYSESIEKVSTCHTEELDDHSNDDSPNEANANKADSTYKDKDMEISENRRDRRRDDRRGDRRPPVRSNNWLKDLIEILLYQEIINRRRRYRSRRRWF